VLKKWKVVLLDNTTFGTKATLLISEEGLNFFLSRSDKPKALPLQKWIASELLPTIQKTGGSLPTKADDTEADILARHRCHLHHRLPKSCDPISCPFYHRGQA
jgi:prophage antirepressor-like protein